MTDTAQIYNWHRISDRITTSGQPSEAQLGEIKALGIGHIVNLGLHDHKFALPDEPAYVSALDMDYVYIPVDFDNPTDANFECFCDTMKRLDHAVVHVHCIANYRVSAFFYRYHRDILGWPEAKARAEMEKAWSPPEGIWRDFIGLR